METFYIVMLVGLFVGITIAICNEKPPKKEIPKKYPRGEKWNRK
jgi:hypothetical protein